MGERFCYLVRTHRDPPQIARLVRTIGRLSPGSLILVAHDASGSALSESDLESAAETRLLLAKGPSRRSYFSMLSPWFAASDYLQTRNDWTWLASVSGSDYPVRDLQQCQEQIVTSGADGFLEFDPALAPVRQQWRRHQGERRYYYRYRDVGPRWRWLLPLLARLNGVQSQIHVHRTYGPRLGVRCARTPFDSGRRCYLGQQWTTLRRACVERIREARRDDRELVEHFRHTISPEEAFFQTVLLDGGRFRLVNDDRRFHDFKGSRDGSPRTLGAADLPELASGRYDFARKFAATDVALLDRIDRELLGLGPEQH